MYREAIYCLEQRLCVLSLRLETLERSVKKDKDLKHFLIHDVKERESIEAALEILKEKQILNG